MAKQISPPRSGGSYIGNAKKAGRELRRSYAKERSNARHKVQYVAGGPFMPELRKQAAQALKAQRSAKRAIEKAHFRMRPSADRVEAIHQGALRRQAAKARSSARNHVGVSMDDRSRGAAMLRGERATLKKIKASQAAGVTYETRQARIAKRAAAKAKSSRRYGLTQATQFNADTNARRAKAAELRATRASSRKAATPMAKTGGSGKTTNLTKSLSSDGQRKVKRYQAKVGSGLRAGLGMATATSPAMRRQAAASLRANRAALKSAKATPATAAVTRAAKRQAAKAKSSARNNTENNQYSRANRAMVLKQRRALNRQAKADWDSNASKRAAYNSVIHNAPVPKGTPIRISAADRAFRVQRATQDSSARHRAWGPNGAPASQKGSAARKQAAAELRQRRQMDRFMRKNSGAITEQRKEDESMLARVKASKPKLSAPKAKRPDPGGKKGFARYQAKLNSSKRVYGTFPKGKSAKPFSPERRLAAQSLRAARAQGLRGPGKARTAAQRAASIRNLAKARASRMKVGSWRPKGKR